MVTNTTDHAIFIYSQQQLLRQAARRRANNVSEPKPKSVNGIPFSGILLPGEIARFTDAQIVYDGTDPKVMIAGEPIAAENIAARLTARSDRMFHRGFRRGMRKGFK